MQRAQEVDARRRRLGEPHAARRDDAVARLQLRAELEADRAVFVHEDAVARGHADGAAVGGLDLVELLGQRVAQHGADRPEADFVVADPEAEHLAEVRARAPLAARVARRWLGERRVDDVADLRHADAARVAHEDVLLRVDAHDDDLAVAQLLDVEVVRADAGAERGDDRLDLLVVEHLVEARLLDVQDLAAQRQDRLVRRSRACLAVPPAESPSTRKSSVSSALRSGSRRACRAGCRRPARPCGARGRAACGPPRARAPRAAPC